LPRIVRARIIIVTSRYAPVGCAAKIIIDREKLKDTGAVTLSFGKNGKVAMRAARAPDEDRPWSPAPKRSWGHAAPLPVSKDEPGSFPDEEPENGAELLD
jgi:competence protein ComEC